MSKRILTNITVAIALFSIPAFAANEKNYTYLALGDSIAFGLDPRLLPPPPTNLSGVDPFDFAGYPETVAALTRRLQNKKLMNAACPGETSASFLSDKAVDLGCRVFKMQAGLRAEYSGTQGAFAVAELLKNKKIDLVTLNIGGNDLSILQYSCTAPAGVLNAECVQKGLPATLGQYAQNLTGILTAIRSTGYRGTLILLKQYSPSADPLFQGAVLALNDVMSQVSGGFSAKLADGFTAFAWASASNGGDPCAAGLLIRLSTTTCDIHPSPKGRLLLAGAVMVAIYQRD